MTSDRIARGAVKKKERGRVLLVCTSLLSNKLPRKDFKNLSPYFLGNLLEVDKFFKKYKIEVVADN